MEKEKKICVAKWGTPKKKIKKFDHIAEVQGGR